LKNGRYLSLNVIYRRNIKEKWAQIKKNGRKKKNKKKNERKQRFLLKSI